jgi:hypothetical protein
MAHPVYARVNTLKYLGKGPLERNRILNDNIKIDLRAAGCENGRSIKLVQDLV